ncbi:MAG: aminoglycoside phosphotransferase family protein [Clostridia bacterium]|nr:aminoglycoside phosphotransferase family protein [Clostridia bacterium]
MTIKEICSLFNVKGKYVECKEIPTGNINSTYAVTFDLEGQKNKYVVQRINKRVFLNPEQVMDNIVRVTDFVCQKVKEVGIDDNKFVLHVLTAKTDEKPFVIDDEGEYWRCYCFIPNAVTYDATTDLGIIEQAGGAFGRFQKFLQGFDAKTLYESIPDFHDTIVRYEALHQAVTLDPFDRAKKVSEEIEYCFQIEEKATELQRLLREGVIPLRVTHNDTKCNNVCFDKITGEALAVLDLDTVMSGAVAHDFGDAIRFVANTLIEDDPNVDEVAIDMEKYEAFTKGFVGEIKDVITKTEKATLNLGVFAMTVELAIRFLTDYLLGDKYFKTKYPGHNVDRTRNQLALAKDILLKGDLMDAILQKYC